jgi:lysozyme
MATRTKTKPINVVIDLSHHQEIVDFKKIKEDGIVGVIHKATEGLTFVDKMYAERRDQARDAGLLWGAYHFGVGADASDQADFFLNTAKTDDETLVVLDYEPNVTGPTMTLSQAREFIDHLSEVVGRFPGMYSEARK